jgi:uncharacterized double-CXXCG motif protein
MKIFSIEYDPSVKARFVEASYKWCLPGVSCPVCNSTWGGCGLEYPSVDLSGLPEIAEFKTPRVEPLEQIKILKQIILKAFPSLPKVEPGTSFGPLFGKGKEHYDGFVWSSHWTLLITTNALSKLNDSELSLPKAVKANITFKKQSEDLHEFEILPEGKLLNGIYPPEYPKYCSACGRNSITMPQNIIIERSSLPTNIDMFRLGNFPTIILVTEKFVNAVNELEIKGIIFHEVEVI